MIGNPITAVRGIPLVWDALNGARSLPTPGAGMGISQALNTSTNWSPFIALPQADEVTMLVRGLFSAGAIATGVVAFRVQWAAFNIGPWYYDTSIAVNAGVITPYVNQWNLFATANELPLAESGVNAYHIAIPVIAPFMRAIAYPTGDIGIGYTSYRVELTVNPQQTAPTQP